MKQKKATPQGAEVLTPKRPPSPSKPSVWVQVGKWAAKTVAEGIKDVMARTRPEARVQRCPKCGVVYLSASLRERGADPGAPPVLDVALHVCDDPLLPKTSKTPNEDQR